MIEDLLKLKKQIDCMIETYKDLHPDSYEITGDGQYKGFDKEEMQKNNALKKIREGTYESTFRKKQREKTTKLSEGPPSLCVYGDS
mgnify:CR=1 FL=1|tara:strand:- start:16 stop:273 length:258 start_codon:yes stop_codon:yes gene_type:complete